MPTLSSQQVYAVARQAGASHSEAITLTAIAKGESGWNTNAHNPRPPDNSYGLWQINMLGNMGANRRKQFGIASNEALWNPTTNARAAVAILRGQGLRAWSVYTNGSYKNHMGAAQQAGQQVGDNWQSVIANSDFTKDSGVGGYIGGTEAQAAGYGGQPAGPQGLPPNASPQQIEDYIREQYPQASGFLDIPEIRNLLIAGATAVPPWTIEKLNGKLQATAWWKKNADATRSYYALKATDPAQFKALIDQKVAELTPQFRELGVGGSVAAFAEQALKYGWTPDQIRNRLSKSLAKSSKAGGLKDGTAPDLTADELMAIARTEYFVPVNRQDAERWAIDIYAGTRTVDSLRDYFGRLAASRFPGLGEQGFTPGEYMAPIRNIIAETLEIAPQQVDLLDRRWSAVLEQEGKDGTVRPMSLAEASKWARKQEAYKTTKGAQDEAAGMVDFIGRAFGSVA